MIASTTMSGRQPSQGRAQEPLPQHTAYTWQGTEACAQAGSLHRAEEAATIQASTGQRPGVCAPACSFHRAEARSLCPSMQPPQGEARSLCPSMQPSLGRVPKPEHLQAAFTGQCLNYGLLLFTLHSYQVPCFYFNFLQYFHFSNVCN